MVRVCEVSMVPVVARTLLTAKELYFTNRASQTGADKFPAAGEIFASGPLVPVWARNFQGLSPILGWHLCCKTSWQRAFAPTEGVQNVVHCTFPFSR